MYAHANIRGNLHKPLFWHKPWTIVYTVNPPAWLLARCQYLRFAPIFFTVIELYFCKQFIVPTERYKFPIVDKVPIVETDTKECATYRFIRVRHNDIARKLITPSTTEQLTRA